MFTAESICDVHDVHGPRMMFMTSMMINHDVHGVEDGLGPKSPNGEGHLR